VWDAQPFRDPRGRRRRFQGRAESGNPSLGVPGAVLDRPTIPANRTKRPPAGDRERRLPTLPANRTDRPCKSS
jgi:hypothetical protein